jgi:hypothetical protein
MNILDANRLGSASWWENIVCRLSPLFFEECVLSQQMLGSRQETRAAIRQVCRQWRHDHDQCVTGVAIRDVFSEPSFAQLSKFPALFPALTRPNLDGCRLVVDDTWLQALPRLTALTSLILADCDQLASHDCLHTLTGLTALTSLDLSECLSSDEEVPANGLHHVASLINLTDLNILILTL